MSQETTLPKPLSGAEMAEAICFDIKQALLNDATFAEHLAYSSYSFKGTIHVTMPSAMRVEYERPIEGGQGEVPADATTVTVEASRAEQPPNEVRFETEQPIPIMVSDDKGRVTETTKSYSGKTVKGKALLNQKSNRNKVFGA